MDGMDSEGVGGEGVVWSGVDGEGGVVWMVWCNILNVIKLKTATCSSIAIGCGVGVAHHNHALHVMT